MLAVSAEQCGGLPSISLAQHLDQGITHKAGIVHDPGHAAHAISLHSNSALAPYRLASSRSRACPVKQARGSAHLKATPS